MVEFTQYHYIQEFLQKLCKEITKLEYWEKFTQNERVYQILKVNVKYIQYCKSQIDLREVLVEFTQNHFIQEFL